MKGKSSLLKSIVSDVDTIYDFTREGFNGSFSQFKNSRLNAVVAELVRRGVLRKTGNRRHIHYEWAVAMAPNKTFYKSVEEVIYKQQRERDKKYAPKRRARIAELKAQREVAPAEIPAEVPAETPDISGVLPNVPNLKNATLEELWAEMQSRGVVIEDNHLVVIKKTIFA